MQNALIHGQPTLFRRILKWPYFPFIIFGIIMYIIHLSMQAGISDDAWAVSVYLADGFNVFDYLVYRFAHWSSRILLELLIMPSIGMPFMLWKVFNTLAYVSAGVFISKIFVKDANRYRANVVIVCMMLLYPVIELSSAGWVASAVSYLWPLAFGLMAAYPLRKIADGKKLRGYEYALYAFLLVLAANHELMCVIMLAVYGAYAVFMTAKRKISIFVFVQLGICLLSLAYILACPGNAERLSAEMGRWFPDYAAFSLVQRAELGVSASLSALFLTENWLFLSFSFFLCVMVWQKYKNALCRLIAAAPLFFLVTLFILHPYTGSDSFIARLFGIGSNYGFINSGTVDSLFTWAVLFAMLFACGCELIALFCLLGKRIDTFIAASVLALGTGAKVAIGLSPTIWASAERTGIFMMFALIVCIAVMMNRWNGKNREATQLMLFVAVLLGLFGGLVNIVSI